MVIATIHFSNTSTQIAITEMKDIFSLVSWDISIIKQLVNKKKKLTLKPNKIIIVNVLKKTISFLCALSIFVKKYQNKLEVFKKN